MMIFTIICIPCVVEILICISLRQPYKFQSTRRLKQEREEKIFKCGLTLPEEQNITFCGDEIKCVVSPVYGIRGTKVNRPIIICYQYISSSSCFASGTTQYVLHRFFSIQTFNCIVLSISVSLYPLNYPGNPRSISFFAFLCISIQEMELVGTDLHSRNFLEFPCYSRLSV